MQQTQVSVYRTIGPLVYNVLTLLQRKTIPQANQEDYSAFCLHLFAIHYAFNSVDRAVLLFISSQHVLVRTPYLLSEHNLY